MGEYQTVQRGSGRGNEMGMYRGDAVCNDVRRKRSGGELKGERFIFGSKESS